jgi:hypothetical protein
MDNIQLQRISQLHEHTRPYFGGVYSADTLPITTSQHPIFYFCNSDMQYQRGTHWLLLYMGTDVDLPIYFDSLGKKPSDHNPLIEQFLILQGPQYIVNSIRVQDYHTSSCGHFCLYVADLLCRGLTYNEIMKTFRKKNLSYNENLAQGYVNNHMLTI